MSDEIIYTNSQVEQLKNETNVKIEQLKNKIEHNLFKTVTLKVRDVRNGTSGLWFIIDDAYHIEGHASVFPIGEYVYPVIIDANIDGQYTNKFYVVVPTNSNRIVELTDDDTLIVKYIDLRTI